MGKGQPHKYGPSLHGVVGRVAGVVPGYKFTKSHMASGIVWDAETLDAYIQDPKKTIPGTKKTIAGVKSDKARTDLVEFLKSCK